MIRTSAHDSTRTRPEAEGIDAKALPGRSRPGRLERPNELAPVIEAMWRGGMRYHEIASVFGGASEEVQKLICERVPPDERRARDEQCVEAEHPDLLSELDRFKTDLRKAGQRESTIHAYLLGSRLFVRWLEGDYTPGPRRRDGTALGDLPA